MLDFGFARKYTDSNGQLLAPREKAPLMGTFQYAPLNSHENKEQSRKDDLESWFYMACELLEGTLPWAHLTTHQEMADYKRKLRTDGRAVFFARLPPELDHMMTMIDGYSYYERPDYSQLQKLLAHAAEHLGCTLKEPLDWQSNKRLLNKAQHVGELGQSHLASSKIPTSLQLDITSPPETEFECTPPAEAF